MTLKWQKAIPKKGYAICTMGRSGGTWLQKVLATTNALGYPKAYFEMMSSREDIPLPRNPTAQLSRLLSEGTTPNGVYGFKILPLHINNLVKERLWPEAFPKLKFVHLKRRDLLGQAISKVRAMQTSQWRSDKRDALEKDQSTQSQKSFLSWEFRARLVRLLHSKPGVRWARKLLLKPQQGLLKYDADSIMLTARDIVRTHARWDLFFALHGIEPLRLYYEDAAADPQSTCSAIGRLVGLEDKPIYSPTAITMKIQRDGTTAEWKARFLSEHKDKWKVGGI